MRAPTVLKLQQFLGKAMFDSKVAKGVIGDIK